MVLKFDSLKNTLSSYVEKITNVLEKNLCVFVVVCLDESSCEIIKVQITDVQSRTCYTILKNTIMTKKLRYNMSTVIHFLCFHMYFFQKTLEMLVKSKVRKILSVSKGTEKRYKSWINIYAYKRLQFYVTTRV